MPDIVRRTGPNHMPRCPKCKARLRLNVKQETICSCFKRYRWTPAQNPADPSAGTLYQRSG